jgi:opacity protein-like surface antigen
MRYFAVTLLTLLFVSLPLRAQSREITPLIGLQQGGSLSVAGDPGDIESSASVGVTLSFPRSRETMLDFVLLHQSSDVTTGDFFESRVDDVDVTYLQAGGRYLFKPQERFDPYIAATIGGTRVAVADESVVALSFAAGAGFDVGLSERLALRLDGRYYSTLTNVSSSVDCQFGGGGECSLFSEGSNFSQLALSAGLDVRF